MNFATSQLSVKNKATGTPQRVYCIYALGVIIRSFAYGTVRHIIYYYTVWGFQRCSFRQIGAMRRPVDRGTSKSLAPRFFVYKKQEEPSQLEPLRNKHESDMKRFLATTICLLFCTLGFSQIRVHGDSQISLCAYFDGYWSEWEKAYGLSFLGNYGSFIIYDKREGPWYPLFKFTINDFYIPDSSTQKRHRRDDVWYEYKGTVEYLICDKFLTAHDLFKSRRGPNFISEKMGQEAGRPTKKVVYEATIKIAPYKGHPTCYNIYYDNVGLGISDVEFEKVK